MQRNQYTIAQHSESVNTFNFHQHKVSHILNKTHRKVSSSEQHKGTALLLIMHCRKFTTRPAIARVKRTNLCVIQIHKKYMNTYGKFSSQSVTLFLPSIHIRKTSVSEPRPRSQSTSWSTWQMMIKYEQLSMARV